MKLAGARAQLSLMAMLVGVLLVVVGFVVLPRSGSTSSQRPLVTQPIIPADAFPGSTSIPGGIRIKVIDLGIDLPVVAGDGWNAPLYKAATYPGLKVPGQGGRSVIYAHARTGMFGPLFHAKVGQLVEVDQPGGTALHYQIKEYYPRWSSTDLRWLQPLDREELILVTCTTYNPNDPRIVAVAEPIE